MGDLARTLLRAVFFATALAGCAALYAPTAGLTAEGAEYALRVAQAEAERNGWSTTVVVADSGGIPIRLARSDGAFPASADIAIGKARTAALFRKPTGALEASANSNRAALISAGFVLMKGGVPIIIEGHCIGAVGVSGVLPDEDEVCAQAAVDAVVSADLSQPLWEGEEWDEGDATTWAEAATKEGGSKETSTQEATAAAGAQTVGR